MTDRSYANIFSEMYLLFNLLFNYLIWEVVRTWIQIRQLFLKNSSAMQDKTFFTFWLILIHGHVMKISSQMYLWMRKCSLNFGSRRGIYNLMAQLVLAIVPFVGPPKNWRI